MYNGKIIKTNTNKFGALVGDNCKIGANAVLSPGTMLTKNTIMPIYKKLAKKIWIKKEQYKDQNISVEQTLSEF